jgi:hypothetical protein
MAGTVENLVLFILFIVFVIICTHQQMQIFCMKVLVTHALEPSYMFQ